MEDFTKNEINIINDAYYFILRMVEFNTTMENFILNADKSSRRDKRPKTVHRLNIINSFVYGRRYTALNLAFLAEPYRLAAMAGAIYYSHIKLKYITRSNWLKLLKINQDCLKCSRDQHARYMEKLKNAF